MPQKIKIILYLPLILFFIANLFYSPLPAQAVDDSMPNLDINKLQVQIPTLTKFTPPTECGTDAQGNKKFCISWIGEYIAGIYKYAISIVGILAAVVLMIGGVMWIIAGGSATMIGEAKAWIGASLTGLVIALCSYLILFQINPALTVFGPLRVTQVKKAPETVVDTGCSWKIATTDGKCTSGAQAPDQKCTSAKPDNESNYICCCLLGGAWDYDPGISVQYNDASTNLKLLLDCMRNKLNRGIGNISSISDENCIGNLIACKVPTLPVCTTGPKAPTGACHWHETNSRHYGVPGDPNKSYAVDLNDAGVNREMVDQAAIDCKTEKPELGISINSEVSHLHISVSP